MVARIDPPQAVPPVPDDGVLRAIAARDAREAIDAMRVQYGERILRQCLNILRKRPADADDAMQETFMKAFKHLSEAFEGRRDLPHSYEPWLTTIAIRECLGLLRRQYHEGGRFVHDFDLEHAQGSDGTEIERYLETRLLAFCISKLPPDRQELFKRRYIDGMLQKDIALERGKTVSSVCQLLHRLEAKVRECFMGNMKGGDS